MLPGKQITSSDILQMLRRRAWLLVLPPLATLFVALIYSSRVPNLYQSDMLIAIDPQRVPEGFVQSTVTLRTDLRLDAISVQVQSRTNLERMILALDLYPEERRVLPMEDVVIRMRESIEVELERARAATGRNADQPNAFHVRFTYPDANIAAQVTQQLGSLFVEQNARDRGALARATNGFLETQLAAARERLETQERRLEEFRKRFGNELPTQMQMNLQASMTTQLQIQALVESMARDRDRKLMLERMYREASEVPVVAPVPAVQPTTPGALPATGSAAQQLAQARAMLANLQTRFQPDHPDIIRSKRIVKELEAKAEIEAIAAAGDQPSADALPATDAERARRERLVAMAAEIESLDRQIQFKEQEETRLRAQTAEYQRRIEAVPGVESEFIALTRDYETQQAAYKELLAKSGAAKVAVDLEQQQIGEHFRIVDPAGVPVHPLPSMRGRINLMGFAIGLAFGVAVAALLEFRDASFRSDADVMEVLSMAVLANVPLVETTTERVRRRRRTLVWSITGAVCMVVLGYATWALRLWNSVI